MELLEQPKQNPLGTEKIPKLLMRYAIPSVVSMVVMALYNIVDQLFIVRDSGYLGNGATTVAFPLITVMLAVALLIGNGSAAFINLQMGRGNYEVAQKALGSAVTLVTVSGVLICVVSLLFLDPILRALGATDAVLPFAREYTSILVIGAPFSMIASGITAIIRADGSPRYSMIAAGSGAVLNTILDPILIFGFGMGVRGAAIATVISQIVSCILTMYYIMYKANHTRLRKRDLVPDWGISSRIAAYGSSSFITQMAISLVNVVMNNTLTYYGQFSPYGSDIPLSAMGIVMKINAIMISVILGVVVGAQPILGYNYGAGNYGRVRATYKASVTVTFIASGSVCLLFIFFPHTVVSLFGDENPMFNEFAAHALRTFLCLVVCAGIQIPSANYFQAVGKPVKAMTLSMTRQIILLVPAMLILPLFFGLDGVLYAGPFADAGAMLITLLFIVREMRFLKSSETATPAQPGTVAGESSPVG